MGVESEDQFERNPDVSPPEEEVDGEELIEETSTVDEIIFITQCGVEAEKRGITVRQWMDLLEIIELLGEDEKWIDECVQVKNGSILIDADLNFSGCVELIMLPEWMTYICGDLNLSGCTSLTSLPRGLKVKEGHMNLSDCTALKNLPEGLEVDYSLCLAGCINLVSIPEDLKMVGGYGEMDLTGCTALTSLPGNIVVPIDISGCTGLKNIPNNLNCYISSLNGYSTLDDLPKGIEVCGMAFTDLRDCEWFTGFPDDIKINGHLDVSGCTRLTGLPKPSAFKDTPFETGLENNIYLSEDLDERVRRDAKKLVKARKFWKIMYKLSFYKYSDTTVSEEEASQYFM